MSRKNSREKALELVFGMTLSKDTPQEVIEMFKENSEESLEGIDFVYINNILEGINEKRAALDSIIEKNLQNWKLDRISKINLCILEMGIYEMLYVEDVPEKVALNEALELTKNKISFRGFKIIIGIILICIVYILTEASIYGLLMTLIFYYLRNNKRCMFICYTLLSLIPLIAASFLDTDFLDAILKWDYQWMMIFEIIPILLYNGKLGVNNKYAKWIFYILYPLHLIILSIIRDIIKL